MIQMGIGCGLGRALQQEPESPAKEPAALDYASPIDYERRHVADSGRGS
jgi:hypothetical protein